MDACMHALTHACMHKVACTHTPSAHLQHKKEVDACMHAHACMDARRHTHARMLDQSRGPLAPLGGPPRGPIGPSLKMYASPCNKFCPLIKINTGVNFLAWNKRDKSSPGVERIFPRQTVKLFSMMSLMRQHSKKGNFVSSNTGVLERDFG